MSLLLDALKKAAEQKAEKSRQAEADMAASASKPAPETIDKPDSVVDSAQATESAAEDDTQLTAGNLDQTQSKKIPRDSSSTEDDTNLTGNVYDQTQIKSSDPESSSHDDDTEIQLPRSLLSDTGNVNEQDDDDTQGLKFGDEAKDGAEDTELTGVKPTDTETEDVQLGVRDKPLAEDTELTNTGPDEVQEAEAKGRSQPVADDTDISVTGLSGVFDEDETVLLTDDDVGDFMGDGTPRAESPDQSDQLSEPPQPEISKSDDDSGFGSSIDDDVTEIRASSGTSEVDSEPVPQDDAGQEDYSISLFDRDHSELAGGADPSELSLEDQASTQNTSGDYSISLFDEDMTPLAPDLTKSDESPKEITDPDLAQADKTGLRSLALIDISESSLDEDYTHSDVTAPSQITADLEPPSKTITRQDSTSTQTYAPDNYDRTLQRQEGRDTSKVFSGMKSESGDVLTPEHAKQIFHSKSSSQGLQNFKIYGGLSIIILLVIMGVGLFQLEAESESIDNALRPLKRDPMPGLIRNIADEGFTNVFAGSEVDAQTIKLIENAETVSGSEEVVIEIATEEAVAIEIPEDTEPRQNQPVQATEESQETEIADLQTMTEDNFAIIDGSQIGNDSTGIIEISSSRKITQKDLLLREAYTSYQEGKDDLALLKYNQVLENDPGNRNALLARAAINVQGNNIDLAIHDYQTLLIANPKDSLAMSSMAAIANYSPQQAESMLKLMILDEPDSPYLNFALGNAYGAQNRWQEAQGQYFAALENNPGNPNYAYNLAVSLEHIEKPDVAIRYYQRALDNYNNGLATFNRDVVDQRLEMLRQL